MFYLYIHLYLIESSESEMPFPVKWKWTPKFGFSESVQLDANVIGYDFDKDSYIGSVCFS